MPEAIHIEGAWYIRADAERQLATTRTLKQGELFSVSDHAGDLLAHAGVHGLYRASTRFLSRFELTLFGSRPTVLSSTVREASDLLAVDLTNGDVQRRRGPMIRRETIHVLRRRFLWDDAWYERLFLRNFELQPVRIDLRIDFASDWADIFQVRGTERLIRGEPRDPAVGPDHVELSYDGADGLVRRTVISFCGLPVELDAQSASVEVALGPGERRELSVIVRCLEGRAEPPRGAGAERHRIAWHEVRAALQARDQTETHLHTGNEVFDHWIGRSVQDLRMLVTDTPHGPYPYAGTPWFSCPFGRDGLLTAFEALWLRPELARGVLRYLAAEQATERDPTRDAEPGKILHETRHGEMAATGEIPFGRYYGTVDAAPLFVVLAGAWFQRTGDLETVRQLWPSINAALAWIDRDGDRDGDGFVEYARQTGEGLQNQGWKDSNDSVMHADGQLAEGPIALCEVQAYVYAASRRRSAIRGALRRYEPGRGR